MGRPMCATPIFACILALALVLPAWAGSPTEKIRETTDKILAVVTDPALKAPDRAKERKLLIRKAVDERFDWEEMARRSLARYWAQRTDKEKKDFVDLFGQLLERTYLDKVEGYSGEKVIYEGESVDGDYGVVNMKILTTTNQEIRVEYRMKSKDGDWLVYDISIEGVSLVNNYRVQFSSILARSPYPELVRRLQEKVSEE
ncbi:MAG: ABC transporter substrate-binding protein [Deltaproteobacteria bacterium]|nr:ABC transporter substrate-binding protein [Deltaproteobacteria bacterium]